MKCFGLAFALALLVVPLPARAEGPVEVDRILAVVDNQAVTWLDVRARMVPFEKTLPKTDKDYVKKRAEIMRAVLMRRIDELLVAKAARALRLTVEPAEIDTAMKLIVTDNHVTMAELGVALRDRGMSMEDYRAELSRQILEGKYVQHERLAAPPKNVATQAEMVAAIEKLRVALLQKLRDEAYVDIRL